MASARPNRSQGGSTGPRIWTTSAPRTATPKTNAAAKTPQANTRDARKRFAAASASSAVGRKTG
jgi:hypothetical protein